MTLFIFNGEWEFPLHLQAFEGFRDASGVYASLHDTNISNGWIRVGILDDTSEDPDPLPEQIAAINYLIEHQNAIANSLLVALKEEYSNLKSIYEDDNYTLPNCPNLDDYKKNFGIGNAFIHQDQKDGLAYIGFECGCVWDEEHGLGFMTHGSTVIGIGSADECMFTPIDSDGLPYQQPSKPKIHLPNPKYDKLKPSLISENEMYENRLIEQGYNDDFIALVESGKIDININKGLSMTFLERAAQFDNEIIVRYILSKKPNNKSNIIHHVVNNCNKNLVNFLLENDFSLDEVNNLKRTPIAILEQSIKYATFHNKKELPVLQDMLIFINEKKQTPQPKKFNFFQKVFNFFKKT